MKSLRRWLSLRLLIGGALLLGIAGAAIHWRLRNTVTAEFDSGLYSSAVSLFAFTEQSGGRVLMELAAQTMPHYWETGGANVFLLREANGREVARSPSLGQISLPLRSGPVKSPVYWDENLPDGRKMRLAGLRFPPLPEDEDPKHITPGLEAVLVVGRDRTPLDQTIAAVRFFLILVGLGSLLALVALVHLSLRAGLRPLDQMGETVARVDAARLDTRFPVETLPSELRAIAARLNELLARLEAAFERERRFTSNVSHELRTPLAELRALAEVNLKVAHLDPDQRESWQDALKSIRRMESMALGLLELARAEHRSEPLRLTEVHLPAAIRDAWQHWITRADARQIQLELALPDNFALSTDAGLLAVILENLCGNAAEHATPGTNLRVSAAPVADGIALSFRNQTTNLTEADLPHLFERFWKADSSRTQSCHHGLGLALAAEFARLLHGSLTATLSAGEIEFRLILPGR